MLWSLICERSEHIFVPLSRWMCTNKYSQKHFYPELLCLCLSESPCILEKPESINVLPGSKVQFSVQFSGTPPLTTKWFKSNKEILSSADWSVIKDNTSSTLELFFAKTTDSGDYVCQIQNDVGSASCQATLFVKGY